MLRLYDSTISGNCYKVRLLLSHLDTPYERVEVDVVHRTDRRAVLGGKTPIYRVPVLELEDGRCLGESNAILWHLAQDTRYLPAESFARALVLQWLFFEQNSHEPNLAVARYWVSILGRAEELRQPLEIRRERGNAALAAMEEHLAGSPFFPGPDYSIADMSLFAYTHVAGEGGFDLDAYPAVRAWLDRVRDRPGFVSMDHTD